MRGYKRERSYYYRDPTVLPDHRYLTEDRECLLSNWRLLFNVSVTSDLEAFFREQPESIQKIGLAAIGRFENPPLDIDDLRERVSLGFKGILTPSYRLTSNIATALARWVETKSGDLLSLLEERLAREAGVRNPYGLTQDLFMLLHLRLLEIDSSDDRSDHEGYKGGQKHVGMRGSSLRR